MISSYLHVAVGVVRNDKGEVLLTRRPQHVHQGGLWEFPGGKVEDNEDVCQALKRELAEELGIEVKKARPLIRVPHHYNDKSVLLDVWGITDFEGRVYGREGQPFAWVPVNHLVHYSFPAANKPIITAVRLPSLYLITGSWSGDEKAYINKLERALKAGIRLIQLRVKDVEENVYRRLARQSLALCQNYGAELLLNTLPSTAYDLDAHGVHLSAERLMGLNHRPLGSEKWVAASCHNQHELQHAMQIGVDFVVLSPVLKTPSHPQAKELGWQQFSALCEMSTIPIFALGGMTQHCLSEAQRNGAQGVAAISAIWNAENMEKVVKNFCLPSALYAP